MRYSVRADAGTKTAELDIYDDIGEGGLFFEAVSAKYVRRFLKAQDNVGEIRVRINSKGGDVIEGFAIYNLLKDHPAKVVAEVDGLAASMASVILMAADEIRMASNARIMIHNPGGFARGESKDLRRVADLMDSLRDDIADAYVARTGINKDKVLKMMAAETWLTAAQAKKYGFADEIVPPKAKPQARIAACLTAADLDDFENVPEDLVAELRTSERNLVSVGESATLSQVEDEIIVEVEMPQEQNSQTSAAPAASAAQTPDLAAVISQAVTAALAPVTAKLGELEAKVAAGMQASAQADAATFAASVNAACERAISAGKLPNSPEARAFFASQAKDAASLANLEQFYASAPPIVATAALTTTVPAGKSAPQLGPQALKLCEQMGWDPAKIYAD